MDAREAKRVALDLVVAHLRTHRDLIVEKAEALGSADEARVDQAVESICDELERRGKS